MKITYTLWCTLLSILLISTATTLRDFNNTTVSTAEEEAVKKVIIAETEAFGTRIFNSCLIVGYTMSMFELWDGGRMAELP